MEKEENVFATKNKSIIIDYAKANHILKELTGELKRRVISLREILLTSDDSKKTNAIVQLNRLLNVITSSKELCSENLHSFLSKTQVIITEFNSEELYEEDLNFYNQVLSKLLEITKPIAQEQQISSTELPNWETGTSELMSAKENLLYPNSYLAAVKLNNRDESADDTDEDDGLISLVRKAKIAATKNIDDIDESKKLESSDEDCEDDELLPVDNSPKNWPVFQLDQKKITELQQGIYLAIDKLLNDNTDFTSEKNKALALCQIYLDAIEIGNLDLLNSKADKEDGSEFLFKQCPELPTLILAVIPAESLQDLREKIMERHSYQFRKKQTKTTYATLKSMLPTELKEITTDWQQLKEKEVSGLPEKILQAEVTTPFTGEIISFLNTDLSKIIKKGEEEVQQTHATVSAGNSNESSESAVMSNTLDKSS